MKLDPECKGRQLVLLAMLGFGLQSRLLTPRPFHFVVRRAAK